MAGSSGARRRKSQSPKRLGTRDRQIRNTSTHVSAQQEAPGLGELAPLLEEMLAEEGGPLTAVERRQADSALGVRTRRA